MIGRHLSSCILSENCSQSTPPCFVTPRYITVYTKHGELWNKYEQLYDHSFCCLNGTAWLLPISANHNGYLPFLSLRLLSLCVWPVESLPLLVSIRMRGGTHSKGSKNNLLYLQYYCLATTNYDYLIQLKG